MSTQDKGHHLQAQEKGLQQIPPSWPAERICPAGTLTLNFQPPESAGINYLLSESAGAPCFFLALQASVPALDPRQATSFLGALPGTQRRLWRNQEKKQARDSQGCLGICNGWNLMWKQDRSRAEHEPGMGTESARRG